MNNLTLNLAAFWIFFLLQTVLCSIRTKPVMSQDPKTVGSVITITKVDVSGCLIPGTADDICIWENWNFINISDRYLDTHLRQTLLSL